MGNLTISSASVDTTGKIITVNIAGDTAPVLPATGVTGFTVRLSGTTLPIKTGTAAASAVTLNLYDSIRVGDVPTLDYAPGNVVDSAGTPNTLVASTGTAITNNSTVPTLQMNTNIGAHSLIGVGLEPSEGTAVEAAYLLDRTDGSLVMQMNTIPRGSYRNNPSPAGFVAGTTKVDGAITVEPTPNTILLLLLSLFGDYQSVTSVGSPAFYTYTFKDSFIQRTLTISERQGSSTFLNPGARASGFNASISKTQNETVRMGFDYMALNQLLGFADHELGLDIATYDAYDPWGPTEVFAVFNNVTTTNATNISIKPTKNIGERQVLDGKRGPESLYVEQSQHTATATLLFSTETELNEYFGLTSNATGKRGASNKVTQLPIALLVQHAADTNGNQMFLQFQFPKATFERVGAPYRGPGAISQDVSIITAQDATTGSSLITTVGSYMDPTTLLTAGTAITGVPANAVNSFTS